MGRAIIPQGHHFVSLAIARSLGRQKVPAIVLSEFDHSMTFSSKYCTEHFVGSAQFDFFRHLSADDVVMPLDVNLMMRLSKERDQLRCNLAFGDHRLLEQTMDKSFLMQYATEHGIPSPLTYFPSSPDEVLLMKDEIRYPVAIKPSRQEGGIGITYVDEPDDLAVSFKKIFDLHGPAIIQEKIPISEKYTVGLLVDKESKVRRACVLKEIRNYPNPVGPACCVETVDRPDILKRCIGLVESLHFYGIADIDVVIDGRDGSFRILEINPRFWGSLQGAINAGVDFPYLLYLLARGEEIEKDLHYTLGVRTRILLPNEYRRLRGILLGNFPGRYKVAALAEFLNFFDYSGDYILDKGDVGPFFSLFSNAIRRRGR